MEQMTYNGFILFDLVLQAAKCKQLLNKSHISEQILISY